MSFELRTCKISFLLRNMALRREFRMSDKNKKYAIVILFGLLTVAVLQYFSTNEPKLEANLTANLDYTYTDSDIKDMIKQQVKEKVEAMINSAKAITNYFNNEDGCESDPENADNVLEKYLINRKKCLLKYCGDVCKTKEEFNQGAIKGE